MQANNLTHAVRISLRTLDQPSHPKEIASIIIGNNLFSFQNPKPEESVASCLRKDISKNGDKASFVRIGTGIYGLNPTLYPEFNQKPIANPPSNTLPSGFIKFGEESNPDFLTKLVNAANTMVAKIKQELWF